MAIVSYMACGLRQNGIVLVIFPVVVDNKQAISLIIGSPISIEDRQEICGNLCINFFPMADNIFKVSLVNPQR